MVKELEVAIERLQALYNQYFMGIEKLEPLIPKKVVERKFDEMRRMKFANTALRFRFQSQVQKYSTHLTHWRRICRQIEEGTYKRDVMRAKARVQVEDRTENVGDGSERRMDKPDDGLPIFDLEAMLDEVEDAFEQGFDLDEQMNSLASLAPDARLGARDLVKPAGEGRSAAELETLRQSGVPVPVSSVKASRKTDIARNAAGTAPQQSSKFKSPGMPPVPPPASPVSSGERPPVPPSVRRVAAITPTGSPPQQTPRSGVDSNVDDKKIQSVYRAYLSARKQTNERTDNISLEKIADILKKTEKSKGGVSDFKVVIRGGKAVIKAVK